MENENINEYKGFNKGLTKEDLDEEELENYNKLMEGIIRDASDKEKSEIAHLMEVVIESEETEYTHCARCNKKLIRENGCIEKDDKKIYCDTCIKKMWSPRAVPEDIE